MSTIGEKMFNGAGIGAGIGALGGGIAGAIKANNEIEKLPLDTVHLQAYDKPTYETVRVGTDVHIDYMPVTSYDSDGDSYTQMQPYVDSDPIYAQFPRRLPNGSFEMQHVPEQNITKHGKGVTWTETHSITEPNIDRRSQVSSRSQFRYDSVGEWVEPRYKFETGVNTLGYVLGYGAVGAALGAIGGAIVGFALGKHEEAQEGLNSRQGIFGR